MLLFVVVQSCTNKTSSLEAVDEITSHKVYQLKGGWTYAVFEFEGHKYISSGNGIVHAESCRCKRFNTPTE